MNISELSFEGLDGSDLNHPDGFDLNTDTLEIVDEFFDIGEEPIAVGRIYKGAKYTRDYEFGLYEGAGGGYKDTVFEDENYLVGYEPDCSSHMFKKMSTYKPVDKTRKRFKNLIIYEA